MNLIDNEQLKLRATWLNTISAAAVVAGVIAPVARLRFADILDASYDWEAIAFSLTWLLAGVLLHFCAEGILGELFE